jgi:uncharacterized Zn-binding protein involved in type VI secretion
MPGIVRTNVDTHQGHSGSTGAPYHKTYYASGSGNVFVNNQSAVRTGDRTACGDPATAGSATVLINNKPVHRIGDATGGHSEWRPNSAATGSSNVGAN